MEANDTRSTSRAYLDLARPKQWTKNGFVLAGLVFSGEALQLGSILWTLAAFVAFCGLSSAVYAANDVLDVKEDRLHPLKRLRPVAVGDVSARSALVFAAVLAAGGLALCFSINFGVGVAGLSYLGIQAVYTTVLKHMAILDVMSISAGFVVRALAGVAAVDRLVSPWLIVCTGLLTLFLGFSKRRHELAALGGGAAGHRRNLREYSVPLLDEMMNIMMSATIIAYVLYTFTVYDDVYMMASIPFVIYGVFRYMLLVHRDGGDNPDVLLLKDRPLQVTLVLWLVTVMTIIYLL